MTHIANTPTDQIVEIVKAQKEFFRSGKTLDVAFRKQMLLKFQDALAKWEKPLCDALWQDLHKSYEEAYLTEISIVKAEIRNHIKNVKRWARTETRPTPIKLFPASSHVVKEPLGNALIISPWNYPVQLLLNPLVGAISAGCTAVLKPSPYVPTVSAVLQQMIEDTFACQYIAVVQGNRDVNTALLQQRYDLIFFTGSPALAKTVMAAAAKNLTPLVLELGGKSPCVIDRTADVRLAAKRIAWGKTINSGQTCIAPDYILIHQDVKAKFVEEFGRAVHQLHGSNVAESNHYVRMVNQKAFDRVSSYLKEGDILFGGHTDAQSRYIEPTLLDNVSLDSKVMTEEIFGPIFPIISFNEDFSQRVTDLINGREKPLAFYYFGDEKSAWKMIGKTSSGGACINDVVMHIANENLPFGGVGNSGMGRYHSKESFDAFTHKRAVVSTKTWADTPFRYMPYKLFELAKKVI